MLIIIAFEVEWGFGVEGGFFVVGDEFANHPMIKLVFCSLLAFAELSAESFELWLIEGVGEVVEHVLGAATLGLGGASVAFFEEVAEELHLAP